MGCDINTGRLTVCQSQQAGIKTVFLMKHSDLEWTKDVDGVIDDLGVANVMRFEQTISNGSALQEVRRGEESVYIYLQADITLYDVLPQYIDMVNAMKAGYWAIFYADMEKNIRLLGEYTPMSASGGAYPSGTAPGDRSWANLQFQGQNNDWAPYLEPYTDFPFDNFPNITVLPGYDVVGRVLANNALDNVLVNNASDLLDFNS